MFPVLPRLYFPQFAYFVASIFSKIRSSESSGEGPLQVHPLELAALSKRPRTEEAWAVAQGRAGALWRLQRDERGRRGVHVWVLTGCSLGALIGGCFCTHSMRALGPFLLRCRYAVGGAPTARAFAAPPVGDTPPAQSPMIWFLFRFPVPRFLPAGFRS